MAGFVYTQEQLGVQFTGHSVTIPNNPYAKLMYYVNCANNCLGNVLPSSVTNYNNYARLTESEKTTVLACAAYLSPDVLLGKIFFPVEDYSPLLQGSNNKFIEISLATRQLGILADENVAVMVDGTSRQAQEIMVCNKSWIMTYYIDPLRAVTAYNHNAYVTPYNNYGGNRTNYNYTSSGGSGNNSLLGWLFICLFIALVLLIPATTPEVYWYNYYNGSLKFSLWKYCYYDSCDEFSSSNLSSDANSDRQGTIACVIMATIFDFMCLCVCCSGHKKGTAVLAFLTTLLCWVAIGIFDRFKDDVLADSYASSTYNSHGYNLTIAAGVFSLLAFLVSACCSPLSG